MEILQPHSGPANKVKNLHFYRQIHSRKHKWFRIKETKTNKQKNPLSKLLEEREETEFAKTPPPPITKPLSGLAGNSGYLLLLIGHQEQALPKPVPIPKLHCLGHPEHGSSTSSSALVSWNNLHPLAQALLFKKKWCLSGLHVMAEKGRW